MTTVVDPNEYVLDAGELDYKDADGNWVSLGATMDNNVYRITQTKFSPTLSQARAKVKGLTRIINEMAELECSLPQLTADNLALMLPATSIVESPITETAAGFATDLDGDVAAGDSDITVTSAVGITVGDYLRIEETGGDPAVEEYRQVTAIAGAVLTLDRPLLLAHADAATVTQTDGDGRATRSGGGRVIPDEDYHDYRLRVQTLDGLIEFLLYDALCMSDSTEFSGQREGQMAPRVKFEAHSDPANLSKSVWEIITPKGLAS